MKYDRGCWLYERGDVVIRLDSLQSAEKIAGKECVVIESYLESNPDTPSSLYERQPYRNAITIQELEKRDGKEFPSGKKVLIYEPSERIGRLNVIRKIREF